LLRRLLRGLCRHAQVGQRVDAEETQDHQEQDAAEAQPDARASDTETATILNVAAASAAA
jgi:hypothetical protein